MSVHGRRVVAAGLTLASVLLTAFAQPATVSPPGMKAFEVSAAVSGKASALAWHGGYGERDVIELQWLDDAGQAKGAAVALTDGARKAYEPDLQLVGGQPVLAWYEKDDASVLTAFLGRFDAAGKPVWRVSLGAEGAQSRNPVVRVGRGAIHVAWIETRPGVAPEVRAARYRLDGRRIGAPLVAGQAGTDTWNLNAAISGGVFHVVWDARLGERAHELHLARIAGGAVRRVRLSADDGHASLYPDLAINGRGDAALTWFDEKDGNTEIYLTIAPLSRLLKGQAPEGRRITHTPEGSIGAYLAWNGDRLGLVWCDGQEGQNELYGQAFDRAGNPAGDIQRLTHTPAQSSIPSIRAAGKGFLIGWNEYQSGSDAAHGRITTSAAMSLRAPASLAP